jgi:hypothetical protein
VIKDCDLFGHNISLNFDEKGNTHQTLCGGCCSFLLVIAIMMLACICGWRIGTDKYLTSFPQLIDFEQIGSIDLKSNGGIGLFLYIYE